MATSSILGADRAPQQAAGRDNEALGPSDSSDSASDVAGIDELDSGDPSMPVDAAIRGDSRHPDTSLESIGPGIDADAAGTGERRSAAGDAGSREASDIAPDRIEGGMEASDEDEALDAIDTAATDADADADADADGD
ncbi:MAG TPA: chemotaxis protein [Methylibium sp.]|uniref:chemotaxis protein n=1 Tax=Methylibium sp. TaxID=2067992 RepID=UPI002DB57838|nr:chemotaxis protein [Methylibium sp.]HEU4460916.1 chemotaxis protein [Methylibium sp.]